MMPESRLELEAESWAFALDLYARPGVAEACLALQNEAGVDVMLLLAVTFATVERRLLLKPDEITALNDCCRPWREQIVWPLRKIRIGLKTGPSPAPGEETEQFRSRIKAVELAAERLQNQILAEGLPLGPTDGEPVTPERLRAVLVAVVNLGAELAEGQTHAPTDRLSSAIDTIVTAALHDAA
jgi:uncharacterized protein (TIGR02444 family)